jgi:subtilisin family serine protease
MNALEAAYEDGFDVANMSLGGGAQGIQDLLTIAVDNLDLANMVVAVAAGNTGPGHYTIESPGSAARALTAGATSVPHFVGAPVTVSATTYGAASGDFAAVSSDLTAPLSVVLSNDNLGTACSALPANTLTGRIALIARGACTFSTKIRNAQVAGAIAVLVANNAPGDPVPMGGDGTPNQPTVPAYMVSVDTGAALKPLSGSATTIGATMAYLQTTNADLQASFSSQGPTDVDFRVKPDVMAPGVSVLSSIPRSFCEGDPCFAFFDGTSMATPHLAGSAAIVRQQHPLWSAAEIRSAVVNTADQAVVKAFNTGAIVTDSNVIGAGRENLLAAVNAKVALDPVSVSFGAVPAGSAQTRSETVSVQNLSGGPLTLSLAVVGAPSGVAFSVGPASVTIASGESAQVVVTMAAQRGASLGDKRAKLAISSGGTEVAHAVLFTFVK